MLDITPEEDDQRLEYFSLYEPQEHVYSFDVDTMT